MTETENERDRLTAVFLDVQSGLPRQGPGADASTLKALSHCRDLPDDARALDIGCGPGVQTLALARSLKGRVTAVDVNEDYLDALRAAAARAGLESRLDVQRADMTALPFANESFDLVWAEGAAYIMGFGEALGAWRRLLRPGGYIAVTELIWARPDPSEEAAAFFGAEYPAMTDAETILARFRDEGYEPRAHFALPDSDWWTHYYTPLEAKLPALTKKYAGDEDALAIVESTRREIDMRRRHGACYDYAFFIAQKPRS